MGEQVRIDRDNGGLGDDDDDDADDNNNNFGQ